MRLRASALSLSLFLSLGDEGTEDISLPYLLGELESLHDKRIDQ